MIAEVKLTAGQAWTVARLTEWYDVQDDEPGVSVEPADPEIAMGAVSGRPLPETPMDVRVFAYAPNPNSRAFLIDTDGRVAEDWVIEE